MIEFGHGTHVGLRRTRNEDTYYANPQRGLFLVADGLGGHEHGEVASALARDVVVDRVAAGCSLAEAIQSAGDEVMAHASSGPDALPMGTTLAALRLLPDRYEIAWIGDSRVYLQGERLEQVSHDHSLVQELHEAGRVKPAVAPRNPQRNVLTQALGITSVSQLQIGMARGVPRRGISFLLCTDGLSGALDHATLDRLLRRRELAPQECVDHLLLEALEHDGSDNITAIVVRIS